MGTAAKPVRGPGRAPELPGAIDLSMEEIPTLPTSSQTGDLPGGGWAPDRQILR